jgi:hypothetical protein
MLTRRLSQFHGSRGCSGDRLNDTVLYMNTDHVFADESSIAPGRDLLLDEPWKPPEPR